MVKVGGLSGYECGLKAFKEHGDGQARGTDPKLWDAQSGKEAGGKKTLAGQAGRAAGRLAEPASCVGELWQAATAAARRVGRTHICSL